MSAADQNVSDGDRPIPPAPAAAEQAAPDAAEQSVPAAAEQPALESQVREALRAVVDPEIRIDVVALGLIRHIAVADDVTEIQMILTTPFCPYGGILVQQVKDVARSVVGGDVHVTLMDEMWSPDMIEGGDLAEWGLL
jgi:metal-sulfur cluster biosynthetic enzyme